MNDRPARSPAVSERSDGNNPARRLSCAEALASVLPPLLVASDRVASTVSQGVHGRRRVGAGETFWQFRRYQPGDSAHRIDWRQSAKSDRVYLRETEWEAAQSVWLWCDRSPSMCWRSSREHSSKLERAELLTLALATLLARGGEHFALLGNAAPPGAGRATLRRLADVLERRDRPASNLPPPEPLPRNARIVLFSDFLVATEELAERLAAFTRRGVRGHIVQIFDPAEETLPFTGRVLFEGAENDGHVLFGRIEAVREDYRRAFAGHQAALRELCRRVGWTMLVHRTDHAPQTALLALYLTLGSVSE